MAQKRLQLGSGSDTAMIPSDIRLYTWLDAEEVLLRVQQQGTWPDWLVWARAYWDGLTLGIRPGSSSEASLWLTNTYEPRFNPKPALKEADGEIVLEGRPSSRRALPVVLEETEEAPPSPRLVPSLARPTVLGPPGVEREPPPRLPEELPPVVVFHSFKGGVGRTTHAIALALALLKSDQRPLLVDADLEAPGISWLLQHRLPEAPVAFADFLALVHGEPNSEATEATELVADRLLDALVDGIYVLPAFRSPTAFASLEVRPEHLIRGAEDPYILTRVLAQLGKAVGANAVLVDLRAGLSELATGLLLDPRVYRILITTLSGQAVAGTCLLLDLLGRLASSMSAEDPLPSLVISQVTDESRDSDLLEREELRLVEAAKPFLGEDGDRDLPVVRTPFDQRLMTLPPSWDEAISQLQRSEIVERIRSLIDWLPSKGMGASMPTERVLREKREKLREIANRMVYAESGEGTEFLATTPLRHLASQHRAHVPIAVIVGAKGAGKTYTFLQVIRRRNWQAFAADAGVAETQIAALIYPVLESKNLQSPAQDLVRTVRQETAAALSLSSPQDASAIRDYIRDALGNLRHEGEWRQRWMDVIAWGIGLEPGHVGAGRLLPENLAKLGKQLLLVVDGLEDLFQEFAGDRSQQMALRALLQEVPDWLAQQPGRPVGILVFVRRDMVLAAVPQNARQLMARYDPYALKWNREEALRLVAWAAAKAGILVDLSVAELQNQGEQKLVQDLTELWGKKLGRDRSREGRSVEWVILALSDLRGQIQARDLMRLLHLAAARSVDDHDWTDRVLVPSAIREALRECSRKKIEEIEEEYPVLEQLFTRLRDLPAGTRHIPFTREETNLSPEEIKILEDNGVLLREADEYYMPEIFRLGLEFSLRTGARPRVLTLARRAAQGG